MPIKPTYEELELRIKELEKEYSDHKQVTKKLLESEERFKALHDASFGGVIIHDQGLILDCNQGLSDITGFTNEELVGMNGLNLIAPDSLDQVLEKIKSGYAERYEVEGVRKDGSKYPLAIKGKNIPFQGGKARVIEFQDITDRKRVEEERGQLEMRLQQAQKMEAIGTLAGGIAHDFNNILAVILGYGELAKDDAPAGSAFKRDIDQMLLAANRARKLVKQILDFGRQTKSARLPLKIQPLIEEGVKMLRSSIPTTISIVKVIEKDCGTTLADPTQVHQILMNLCTNAYHAMEATGGVLSITLKTTIVDATDRKMMLLVDQGKYLELIVSDTGDGIQPEVIEKIFEPYFTTKEIGKGTGMGLSIIHGIIKNYGGAITVDSRLGEGTDFHVYFPVVADLPTAVVSEVDEAPSGTGRILLVDDEELLGEMGKDILERLGYEVVVFNSSLSALAAFKKSSEEFDAVITDQTMPEMTGLDLSVKLLDIRADIPIILCTGYSNRVDEESAKSVGIKEFVLKPLSKGVIGNLVHKVLHKS